MLVLSHIYVHASSAAARRRWVRWSGLLTNKYAMYNSLKWSIVYFPQCLALSCNGIQRLHMWSLAGVVSACYGLIRLMASKSNHLLCICLMAITYVHELPVACERFIVVDSYHNSGYDGGYICARCAVTNPFEIWTAGMLHHLASCSRWSPPLTSSRQLAYAFTAISLLLCECFPATVCDEQANISLH